MRARNAFRFKRTRGSYGAFKFGVEEGKEAIRKVTGGKKMDKSGSVDLIAEDEGANKKNVKTKLGAFFSKRVRFWCAQFLKLGI